jgi:hypothetical protein
VNGWRKDISDTWAQKCVIEAEDCAAHMLGDGRVMGEFDGN